MAFTYNLYANNISTGSTALYNLFTAILFFNLKISVDIFVYSVMLVGLNKF